MKTMRNPTDYRRLAALRDLDLGGNSYSQDCETIVGLAANHFNVPMVAVSLLDRTDQVFLAQHGMAVDSVPLGETICEFLLDADGPQIIDDAQMDARVRDRSCVTGAPFVRFYAGYPIRSSDGHIVGSFCLVDDKSRTLTDAENTAFHQFGAIAEGMVRAHARDNALKLSQADLLANTQQLTRANSALAQAGRIAKIGRWEINIKTMDVTWSDEVFRIHELDVIEGKSVLRAINYYADHDKARVNAAVNDAIVYGTPFDFAADLISAKGNVRHVRSAGERDMSGSGGARIIGIIQDITDIVEAQSRLTGAALDAGDTEIDDNPPPVPLV